MRFCRFGLSQFYRVHNGKHAPAETVGYELSGCVRNVAQAVMTRSQSEEPELERKPIGLIRVSIIVDDKSLPCIESKTGKL